MGNFTWATETNYPAGTNAWNGMPLAVAPANDYFQPSPATGAPAKITAEAQNYALKSIASNLNYTVTSIAALRALPVPTGTLIVYLSQVNNGSVVNGMAGFGFGGTFAFDPAYLGTDDGPTCIQPNAITSGSAPGRWRMIGDSSVTVGDFYEDASTTNFTASLSSVSTAFLKQSGFAISLPFSATPGFVGSVYAGDIIDLSADVQVNTSSPTGVVVNWTRNSVAFGTNFLSAIVNGVVIVPIKNRYVVTSTDVTAGSVAFSILLGQTTTGAVNALLSTVRFVVRRAS
jgi:hypothetical protein